MTENTAIIKIIDEITACRNITLEQLHMLLETDVSAGGSSRRSGQALWQKDLSARADRVYQLLQKRLSLLRHKAQQYSRGPLPPEYGADYGMLRERL